MMVVSIANHMASIFCTSVRYRRYAVIAVIHPVSARPVALPEWGGFRDGLHRLSSSPVDDLLDKRSGLISDAD